MTWRALVAALAARGGLVGEVALREAADRDYLQIADLVRGALRQAWKLAGDTDVWPYVRALYDTSVVVERDGKMLRYPYSLAEVEGRLTIQLGTPEEVVAAFVKAAELADGQAMAEALRPGGDVFLEAAKGTDGKPTGRFKVRIIRAGLSGNGRFYPDAVLREGAPLFEGARVLVKADDVHLAAKGKDPRNVIGRLSEVVFVEGASADAGELLAVLTLVDPTEPMAVKLTEAASRGMADLFGLSITAKARVRSRKIGERTVVEAVRFTKVESVDLIVEPGAGGAVLDLLEAAGDTEDPMRDKLIARIKAKRPDLLAGKDETQLTEAQLEQLLDQALDTRLTEGDGDPAERTVRLIEARTTVRERVRRSTLPQAAQDRVIDRLLEREDVATLTEAQIADAIKAEQAYLVSAGARGGAVVGMGGLGRIEAGESRAEKTAQMLEAFFDRENKDHRHAQSFRDIYVAITGDTRVTGRVSDADEALMTEALGTSSLPEVLGNTLNRAMVREYATETRYGAWRQLVDVVPVNDFRPQFRVRWGGYGDLPVVGERQPYEEMTSPADEDVNYSVAKRGGTEQVTWEMVRNDQVGAIRAIPGKLGRAARRTLFRFVMNFYRDNPVIFDGTALFHASRNNLGTAAFDAAAWAAARLAVIKQTEYGSQAADRIGIPPRFILLPADLEEAAYTAFVQRGTNNDPTFASSTRPIIVPVDYWTDVNDWVVSADPREVPTLEVGFLDGREEPELFIQDQPNGGSFFYNDTWTWKIRHVYGGAVIDWRGLRKHVVP